jgi:uncharacterized protein YebE (UPF0316 family)
MESFFLDSLGISDNVFSYFILPLLIFLARIGDVSINTIRIIYMLGGRRLTATFMGFFESFIWLMAIRQIFEHLDNWICYIAYPAGFATGILVGMIFEEHIAYGKVIMRIITRKDIGSLKSYLTERQLRYTALKAIGPDGEENVVFTVMEREHLPKMLTTLKEILPTAFYTIEKVNRASDDTALKEESSRWGFLSWFKGVRKE